MYAMVDDLGEGFSVVRDEDEFPILLVPGDEIPLHLWQQAMEHSVIMLVRSDDGRAIMAEEFQGEREEVVSRRAFRVTRWRTDLAFPTVRGYVVGDLQPGQDPATIEVKHEGGFVHLHTHTEYSQLDGLSTVDEIFQTVVDQGGNAVGCADHGNCAVHPDYQLAAKKYGIKPVFGIEAYFVDDRFRRGRSWIEVDGVEVDPKHLTKEEEKRAEKKSDAREIIDSYTHICLWAQTQNGLRNLWAMSTEGYRDGLYDGKPRMDWETLSRLADGVICATGCLRGPVARKILDGDMDGARDVLMRLAAIFPNRLYVEIHCNQLDDQRTVNEALVALAREYDLPLVAAVDSHYASPAHKQTHKVWLAMQTGKTLTEDTTLFQGDQDYHLLSPDEVHAAFLAQGLPEDVIVEAMGNTQVIADQCNAEVQGETDPPTFSKPSKEHPDPVQRDVERLFEVCRENWERRLKGKPYTQEQALARFEFEINLLIEKRFCGYFLIVSDYVMWAKGEGCLVGPSRGSGGGSFVAYLMGITETDPILNDLDFDRFLTPGRTSLPDFDIDFPTSWRGRVTNYIRQRWGEDYTSSIGTVLRMRSKQAFNDVYRVLENTLPYEITFQDRERLKKAIDEADAPLAGKHLPWDEFCDQFSDIVAPMRERAPEVFSTVDQVVDRLKSYGKHAAGVVISTSRPLTDLPMRLTEVTETVNGTKVKTQMMVTQFDMNALEALGYVKFDILTLRTLDTLQETVDLIADRTGYRVNPYEWADEYEDPQVWEEVSSGRTLGLFQVETASGTRMIRRMAPASLEDMAAVVTIVRPGPMRSGLTDSYLRRRAGIEPVSYPDPRMESFVGETYGAMIYQEQVMSACKVLAGYTSDEADGVRKLLGKKEVEKVEKAGQEFISRAPSQDTDPRVAEALWAQMAEFAKYGFNKAHAFAYAVLGYWTAWLKFHYPAEFLVACMSTVDNDRIPEFIEECRVLGYEVALPDVNRSKVPFTADGLRVIYGLSLIPGVGEPTAQQIVDNQPYSSYEDFCLKNIKTGSKVNMGHVRALVRIGAFDEIVENRRALEVQLDREASGEATRCVHKVESANPNHPHRLPCSFDWANEPDPPMLPRGRGKAKVMIAKEPPKACNIRCRQYLKPAMVASTEVRPYTKAEIMEREREVLGVWVSSTPWEMVSPEHIDMSDTAQSIESGAPEAQYLGVCIVESVKKRRDKNGNEYAFVALNMQDGRVEPVCFASVWEKHHLNITPDTLGVAVIWKTSRGTQLIDFTPYPRAAS